MEEGRCRVPLRSREATRGVVWRGTSFKLALWCGSWRGYSTRGYLEEASRESDTGDARSRARRAPVPPIRYSPARSGSSMISLSVQERFNSVLFRCIRRPGCRIRLRSGRVPPWGGAFACLSVRLLCPSVWLLCAISWPWPLAKRRYDRSALQAQDAAAAQCRGARS